MSRGRLIPIGFVILILIGNLTLLLFNSSDAEPISRQDNGIADPIVVAEAIDTDRIVLGTRDDDLVVVQDGQETSRTSFNGSLRDVAVVGSAIVAGGSNGTIAVYSSDLALTASFEVDGQVTQLAPVGSSGILVASGPGGYANRSTLTVFPDLTGATPSTIDVPFNVTALATTDSAGAFGTLNSRLQEIEPSTGREIRTATLSDPVTALDFNDASDRILVGDDAGGLTLIDGTGAILNHTGAGSAVIRTITYDPAEKIWIAGDANGTLYALNDNGAVTYQTSVATRDLALIAPTSDGTYLVIPREGNWARFDPTAINSANQASLIRTIAFGFNIIVGIGFVVSILMQFAGMRELVRVSWAGIRASRGAYLFILPSFALIAVFTYYPVGMSIYYSFTNFSLRAETEWVGLRNYVDILTDDFYFRTGITNMLIMTVAGIIKTLTMPLLAAELVYWLRNHTHQYVYRTLFVLPAVVPDLVFALLWKQVYDPNTGLLNQILGAIGLEQFQRGWLGNDSTALWAVIWVGFPFISAFSFLIYLGGLLSINADYFDASRIDGASAFSRFRHIDVPLLIPQFRIMLFFAFSGTVQGFASIFILTGGGPGYATYVPALQMYLKISDGEFGYASAIGVLLFVMVGIATYFVLHFRKQTVEES